MLFFDSMVADKAKVTINVDDFRNNRFKVLVVHLLRKGFVVHIQAAISNISTFETIFCDHPNRQQTDKRSCGWHVVCTISSLMDSDGEILAVLNGEIEAQDMAELKKLLNRKVLHELKIPSDEAIVKAMSYYKSVHYSS